MKKLLAVITLFHLPVFMQAQDTFSIVAVDPETGEVGSAGASCIGAPSIPEGAQIISYVLPGTGAIHTQSYYVYGNQVYGQSLMEQGHTPQEIIDSLVANDIANNPTIRQYGVVDFTGAAGYSGVNCLDYKNHITGSTYAIQGNILLGQQILDSMEARFLHTEGDLACKLMAALQGAKVPGADTRCLDEEISSLSAFLRVSKSTDYPGEFFLDLNVPGVPVATPGNYIDPIDSLQTLYDAWGGCVISSVNEFSLTKSNLKAYPNPARDHVTIVAASPVISIWLHDDTALEIWHSNTPAGVMNIRIPLANYRTGYLVFEAQFRDGNREVFSVVTQ